MTNPKEIEDFVTEILHKFNITSKDILSFNLYIKAHELPVITLERYVDMNTFEVKTEKLKLMKVQD